MSLASRRASAGAAAKTFHFSDMKKPFTRDWLIFALQTYTRFVYVILYVPIALVVLAILSEWGITPELRIDAGAYKKRKYRVLSESNATNVRSSAASSGRIGRTCNRVPSRSVTSVTK